MSVVFRRVGSYPPRTESLGPEDIEQDIERDRLSDDEDDFLLLAVSVGGILALAVIHPAVSPAGSGRPSLPFPLDPYTLYGKKVCLHSV